LENPFLQLDEDRDEGGEAIPPEPASEGPLQRSSDMETVVENGASAPERGESRAEDSHEDFLAPVEREILSVDSPAPAEAAREDLVSLNGAKTDAEPETPEGSAEAESERFDQVDVSWDDYYDDSENRSYNQESSEEERDFTEYTAARTSLY